MSGHFEFSLESVLQFRKLRKDLEVSLLARALLEKNQVLAEMDALRQKIRQLEDELHQAATEMELDVNGIRLKRDFLLSLKSNLEQLAPVLAEREAEVEKRKYSVMEKSRDQKLMEKLREKNLEVFQRDERRRDEKEIDETVLLGKRTEPPVT